MGISSMWSKYGRDSETIAILSANEDSKIKVWACQEVKWKVILCWIFYFLTFGFLRLFFYWKPTWKITCTCQPCPLATAQFVLIKNEDHEWFIREIYEQRRSNGLTMYQPGGDTKRVPSYRYFTHRKVLYIWYDELNAFHRVFNLDHQVPCNEMHNRVALSTEQAEERFAAYGSNEIYVELKPIWRLLVQEVLNPFYFFQVFSMGVWFAENYDAYAVIIIVITVVSVAVNIYQVRRSQKALRDTIASTDTVTVIRDEVMETRPSTCLVPGDIIIIPKYGCTLQCDAVLVTGTCIVNESMLTGESVPVTKTPVPNFSSESQSEPDWIYSDKQHAKHTLYNGTKVLQTRYYANQPVKALVIRTGFNTTKGQLVRSIMYPKPVDFEFTKDLFRFVGIMGVLAFGGFVYSLVILLLQDSGIKKAIIEACDVITIVVPPALPAAMTIGIIAAQDRLKKQKVYCISPTTINTCGGINAVCFDKTGTLTEDGLGLMGILKCDDGLIDVEIRIPLELGNHHKVVQAMACCHSLTRIDNTLTGDPLDVILFEETQWQLEEPETAEESDRYDNLAPTVVRPNDGSTMEIGIIRQFTFSSNLQRMSVVARILGSDHFMLFCKGAPEMVVSLCEPSSVPENFPVVLRRFTKKGYRVLAIADRLLDSNFVKVQRTPREQMETNLTFLGLIILENRLKEETTPNISLLQLANIRTVMVTGDNILTAISVGRECGVVDEVRQLYTVEVDNDGPSYSIRLQEDEKAPFGGVSILLNEYEAGMSKKITKAAYQLAISGPSFALLLKHFPDVVPKLVSVCNIFARMAPEQKGQLISAMQDLGYIVAMCGDGANDCGALKAAHAGISLSEAEASIASPFTSKVPNISCVPTVIREGRAALVTSFGVFKYMVAYSFTQFISVSILYYINTNLSSYQYLYIDFFLTTVFAVFFGYTAAADSLVAQPPPTRVLTVGSLSSILLQLTIVLCFQMFAFEFVTFQPWFTPLVNPHDIDNYLAYQTSTVFCCSLFQYISLAVIYSKSQPYRQAIYTNRYFSISLLVLTTVCVWVTVNPPAFMVTWLQLYMPPYVKYRLLILILGFLSFTVSFMVERYVIDWLLFEVAEERGWFKRSKPPKYISLLSGIWRNTNWLSSAKSTANDVTVDMMASTDNYETSSVTPIMNSKMNINEIPSPYKRNLEMIKL